MTATLRKYVNIKPAGLGNDNLGKAFKSMTVAHNRLGGAVTNIGVQLTEFKTLVSTYTDSQTAFYEQNKEIAEKEHKHKQEMIDAQQDMLGRKKGLEQDKRAEEKQENLNEKQEEKVGEELGKKEKKSRFGWLKKLLKPVALLIGALSSLIAIPVALGVLDWLSKPENKKKIEMLLRFFKGIWNLSRMFAGWGMGKVIEGITQVFGHDPDKSAVENGLDKFFGILKIVAGLASIYIGSRILMPWKLLSDVKWMTSLGRATQLAEATGCGRVKPKGQRVGRDGRTSKQRLKDIKKLKRARRLAQLQRQLGRKSTQVAAGTLNLLDSAATGLSEFNKPRIPPGFDKTVSKGAQETTEVVAKNKGVMGRLRGLWSGAMDLGAKGVDLAGKGLNIAGDFAMKQVKGINRWFSSMGEGLINGVKGLGQGIWNWGKNAAKSIGDVVELAKNPAALKDKVVGKVKEFIKPTLEKNETVKGLVEFAEAPDKMKRVKGAIGGALRAGFKNPGFKSMREFLQAAKSNAKIGGVDKLVASLLALLDYGVFGESPINAVVKALGGLLGYSAGFAIGAPFGGVPGFITGMAGGFAGEWVGEQLLKLLYMIPGLKDIDDPIAELIGGDFKKRKIIRDPEAAMDFGAELSAAAEADTGEEIQSPDLPELARGGKVKQGMMKKKDIPKPVYTTKTPFIDRFDIPTDGEGQFKRFGSGGLYVFSTAPAGAPVLMGHGKGFGDTYPHHHPKPGGNVPRAGGIPRDYLISELKNPSTPDSKGDRHPIRAGVSGTVDSVGEGWGAVRIKDDSGPMFRSGHMTGIRVKVGDQVNPSTIIGIQDAVGMSNGYVHAHIEGRTAAIHNAWIKANSGSKSTGSDDVDPPTGDDGSSTPNSTSTNTAGDTGGGGFDPTKEYLSTEKIMEKFLGSNVLGQYLKDAQGVEGAIPGGMAKPAPVLAPQTEGIGPVADGDAYAGGLQAAKDGPPNPPGALAPGQRPDKALTNEQWKVQQAARKEADAKGLEGIERDRYIAGRVMGTTAAPKANDAAALNTKMDNLSRLSTDKTRRDKAPKTNSVMVAVQPVVQPAPAAAPAAQQGSKPSSSPLLTR